MQTVSQFTFENFLCNKDRYLADITNYHKQFEVYKKTSISERKNYFKKIFQVPKKFFTL